MKKYLLTKEGKFYKANLHMHTNISDGRMSVEETKQAYLEKGYSIVAFTDHEVMVPHTELSDETFLALTSTEIAFNQESPHPFPYLKCYHLNLYSKEPLKSDYSTFNIRSIWLAHSLQYVTDEQVKVNYKKVYSTDCVNDIIRKAKEEKCLVSYNHPVWSLQGYEDYINLKGLWGVEWYNTGCVNAGYKDSIKPIDELLRKGERVFPLATDDSHGLDDRFGGWVMVKAKNLNYDTIFNALEVGDFYSSSGPEILELTLEDGIINVKTSSCYRIILTTDRRETIFVNGDDINCATFDINSYLEESKTNINQPQYIRITVIDSTGNEAYSRAYFIDELE